MSAWEEVSLEVGVSLSLQSSTSPVAPECIFLDSNGSIARDRLSLVRQVSELPSTLEKKGTDIPHSGAGRFLGASLAPTLGSVVVTIRR